MALTKLELITVTAFIVFKGTPFLGGLIAGMTGGTILGGVFSILGLGLIVSGTGVLYFAGRRGVSRVIEWHKETAA